MKSASLEAIREFIALVQNRGANPFVGWGKQRQMTIIHRLLGLHDLARHIKLAKTAAAVKHREITVEIIADTVATFLRVTPLEERLSSYASSSFTSTSLSELEKAFKRHVRDNEWKPGHPWWALLGELAADISEARPNDFQAWKYKHQYEVRESA